MNEVHLLEAMVVSAWSRRSLTDPLARSLSRLVGELALLDRAEWRVLANSAGQRDALYEFETGNKLDGTPDADAWLVQFVRQQSPTAFVVAEDWTVVRGAKFLQTRSMPAVYHHDEVYYVARTQDAGCDGNWGRVVSNTVPSFRAFVIDGVAMPTIGSDIDEKLLNELASNVKAIILGVYDGESYLTAQIPRD